MNKTANKEIQPVFTIGHSTKSIEVFIELLKSHEVDRLIDIRTMPRSRHNPQFNTETLAKSLKNAGIGYEHIAGLGGFRPTSKESTNKGWRNTSFRGYADYMLTPDFIQNLDEVIKTARHESIALMCAEAVPWRCHRSLVADALTVRDIPVAEIVSNKRAEPHKLTPFAVADGSRITYPPEEVEQPQLSLPLD